MAKKQVKKKGSSKEEFNITRVSRMLLLVLLMFLGIVGIEILTLVVMSEGEYSRLLTLDDVPVSHIKYNDSGRNFRDVSVLDEDIYIKEFCEGGCDLKLDTCGKDCEQKDKKEYKYLFNRKLNGDYLLSIVSDNKYLVYRENIGRSLKQTYFTLYKGYLTLSTIVDREENQHDYVIIIDNENEIDRFSSLKANEIEFTDNGIIYYEESCIEEHNVFANGEVIKRIREPFSVSPVVLDRSYTNLDWCVKED